jgi:cytochrome c oxidase assembly protein subunit 15
VYLYLSTAVVRRSTRAARVETITNALFGLYLAQIVIGVVNVALLAPVWIQIVHLLVSNLIWGVFVLLAAVVFGDFAPRLSHQTIHKPVQSFTGE